LCVRCCRRTDLATRTSRRSAVVPRRSRRHSSLVTPGLVHPRHRGRRAAGDTGPRASLLVVFARGRPVTTSRLLGRRQIAHVQFLDVLYVGDDHVLHGARAHRRPAMFNTRAPCRRRPVYHVQMFLIVSCLGDRLYAIRPLSCRSCLVCL